MGAEHRVSYLYNSLRLDLGHHPEDLLSLHEVANAALGAVAMVACSAHLITSWSAFALGAITPVVLLAGKALTSSLGVDDPRHVFATHGVCGATGCLLTGLALAWENFTNAELLRQKYRWCVAAHRALRARP